MKPVKILLICIICFSLLSGCAVIRFFGKITSAVGDTMTGEANKEEEKRKANKPAVASPVEPAKKGEKEAPPVPAAEPSMTVTEIKEIQQCLSQLGYQPGSVDGKMGKNTIEALKKFQQNNDLSKTGQPDKETVAKLRQKTEAPQKSAPVKVRSATDL